MGVLDAFLATWSKARASFGDGAPQDGSGYDHGSALVQLQSDVQRAGPGQHWTGAGAEAYATAIERQARVLGATADLDRRLGAEVDRSAAVVSSGRRDLDNVRRWVLDVASGVPATADGDRLLYPVVSRGCGEIAEILQRSHADMSAIAGRIRGLGSEYEALNGEL